MRHTGIEAILRKMLSVAYIIGGRKLAISIKRECKRCRILKAYSTQAMPTRNWSQKLGSKHFYRIYEFKIKFIR